MDASREGGADVSLWMELRCEKRGDDCLSNSNVGPMMLAKDGRAGVIEARNKLTTSGERQGWKCTPAGYVCPACKDLP